MSKNLIIMDEIDGMAGNEDRGGVSALIDIIKNTKVPIICICNDKFCQKLKTLTNHCYDVPFSKPDKRQIVQRLIQICGKEGLLVEEQALLYLVESVGNDIRQCLNFLDLWSRRHKSVNFFEMKDKYTKYSKDSGLMLSGFEVCQKMLKRDVLYYINILVFKVKIPSAIRSLFH